MRLLPIAALCLAGVAVPAGVVLGVTSSSNSHAASPPPAPASPSPSPAVVSTTAATSPSPAAPSPSPAATVRVFTPLAEHQTVGVGTVVDLRFDQALSKAEQTAVEEHLQVTTAPATVGAWHWVRDDEVHFRPRHSWKPGTTIAVVADLTGVTFDDGEHGRRLTWTVDVGRSRKSVADLRTHLMTVTDTAVDGTKTVRVVPFSGGTLARPTRGGTFIALSHEAHVVMDSDTVGIPAGSADSYNVKVDNAVRITDSGTYVHGAPWSVASQGHANVSHGCLNVSPADALWFRTTTLLGDLVMVHGSNASYDPADHGSADWSPTWAQILAGSRTGEHSTA